MWEDVKKVRYPKKVREPAKLEAQAVEIGLYECNIIAGLLQTPEYARAVISAAQPPYSPDDVERTVTARLARQSVFERDPAPSMHVVLEEAPLRRQVGGTMVWRQQLERLLEADMIRNASSVEPAELVWFKSSYSGGTNGESCLETAPTPTAIHVRDSKYTYTHEPSAPGPRLVLALSAWGPFVAYTAGS